VKKEEGGGLGLEESINIYKHHDECQTV
jgi:hypothetical protein